MALASNLQLPDDADDLIGMKFSSFSEVTEFIQKFEEEKRVTLIMANNEKLAPYTRNAENIVYRKLYYRCKFSGDPRTEATGVRQSSTYKQGCPYVIYIAPTRDRQFLVIKNAELCHKNHAASEVFHDYIPENRRLSPGSQNELKKLLKLGCNSKLLQEEVMKSKKKHILLKDISNIKMKLKSSDDEDLLKAVKMLETGYGAAVDVLHEDNLFKGLFFITEDMKNSMSSWPEIVYIDGTYMLLANGLTVMLLVVEDGNGLTEVVGVALLAYEDRETFYWFLQSFKTANTEACSKIQCFMGDKDLLERDVLKEVFPGIPIYICRFHVLRTFKRAISAEIAGKKRDECLELLQKLVYSASEEDYDEVYTELQKTAPKAVLDYFNTNWHVIKTEWTAYNMNRGNLNNETNNRLESLNGKIKQVVNKNSSLGGFIERFFVWLYSHNFEVNAKTANAFLKKPIVPYDMESNEGKFQKLLMPFPFKRVLGEIKQYKYLQIEECVDETNKKCLIASSGRKLEVSDTKCECSISTSSFLPCRHIFAVREHFQMPLFAEDLCNERWTKPYTMKNQRAFQQSEIDDSEHQNPSGPTVTKAVSKKPISVQEKRKKVTPFAKEIINLVSHSCGTRFDCRMEQIKELCSLWRKDREVQITPVDDLEDINKKMSLTKLVELESPSSPPVPEVVHSINDTVEKTVDDHLSEIQMPIPMKIAGRPSGYLATTTGKRVALRKKSSLTFAEKNDDEKKVQILKWLIIDDNMLDAVWKKEYSIRVSDLNLLSIKDSFANESVDLRLVMPYFEKAAFGALVKAIDVKKASGILFCGICEKRLIDDSVTCHQCLLEYHFVCVGIKRRPRTKTWFCPTCR